MRVSSSLKFRHKHLYIKLFNFYFELAILVEFTFSLTWVYVATSPEGILVRNKRLSLLGSTNSKFGMVSATSYSSCCFVVGFGPETTLMRVRWPRGRQEPHPDAQVRSAVFFLKRMFFLFCYHNKQLLKMECGCATRVRGLRRGGSQSCPIEQMETR